ncbi:MAG: NADPH-dependent F420 reductase [Candidatus Hodarchaeales archaeon]
MNFGIIGTGSMGMGLATQLGKAGYEVTLGSRDPIKAKSNAKSIPGEVKGGSIKEAIDSGEIIIPAIKYPLVLDVLKEYKESLDNKIVLDISNPVGVEMDKNTSTAEEIAKVIPTSVIVKGFNTVFSSILKSSPRFGNQKVNLFICGDEINSKRILLEIGRVLGYEPIDVGSLKAARHLEALLLFQIYLGEVLNDWEFTLKLLKRE